MIFLFFFVKNNLYNYLLCHNIDDQILTDIYNFHRKEFPIRNLIYYQTQNELMEKLKTNNYKDATISPGAIATVYAHNQQINPIEKVVELYERLLKSEQEKIEILRECIKQGK